MSSIQPFSSRITADTLLCVFLGPLASFLENAAIAVFSALITVNHRLQDISRLPSLSADDGDMNCHRALTGGSPA